MLVFNRRLKYFTAKNPMQEIKFDSVELRSMNFTNGLKTEHMDTFDPCQLNCSIN